VCRIDDDRCRRGLWSHECYRGGDYAVRAHRTEVDTHLARFDLRDIEHLFDEAE
jgi:hypothetical protein